jgi:hypothetical protein
MQKLLQEFEAELSGQGFDVSHALQSGARAADVATAIAATPYPLPPDLLAVYLWKNGTAKQNLAEFTAYFTALDAGNQKAIWPDQTIEPSSTFYRNTPFFPEIGTFMPVNDALASYQDACEHDFWPANFWPIFHDDAVLLNLDPESNSYGQIYLYSPSLLILEPEPYYDSLEIMFTTYLAALKAKLLPFGDELEPNFSSYSALAAELNPLSIISWRS